MHDLRGLPPNKYAIGSVVDCVTPFRIVPTLDGNYHVMSGYQSGGRTYFGIKTAEELLAFLAEQWSITAVEINKDRAERAEREASQQEIDSILNNLDLGDL